MLISERIHSSPSMPFLPAGEKVQDSLKALLVVAHPDDEYVCAATTYRLAKELATPVDQVVITNGEAGFRYSHLAEAYYGLPLTDERTGRMRLPEIRKEETRRAGRILGIRRHYFLDQKDARYTLDGGEAARTWNSAVVTRFLHALIGRERYGFVLILLPAPDTHGHHQQAAVLTLSAVARLAEEIRPVVLGVEPGEYGAPARSYQGEGVLRALKQTPAFTFDRGARFGPGGALNYQIIINWVVAEHKSQGMFQSERHDEERYWIFAAGARNSIERAKDLFNILRRMS